MVRRILAVVAGFLASGVATAAIQSISSLIYKKPADLDLNNFEAVAEWTSQLPAPAFLIVAAAWAVGVFVGVYVARRVDGKRSTIPGVVVWVFFSLAIISSLFFIPSPIWLWVLGILACLIFGLLGLVAAAPEEYSVKCNRIIKAPIEKVFKTLATINEFKQAVPHITNVEFLSDQQYGVGTRFRETRLMNGKEATTELEVTELVENEHVRIVSDAGGAVWDTIFTVKPAADNDGVEMNMQMDARPHQFPARVITPMILGMVSKFVEQDMDSVKAFCEKQNP